MSFFLRLLRVLGKRRQTCLTSESIMHFVCQKEANSEILAAFFRRKSQLKDTVPFPPKWIFQGWRETFKIQFVAYVMLKRQRGFRQYLFLLHRPIFYSQNKTLFGLFFSYLLTFRILIREKCCGKYKLKYSQISFFTRKSGKSESENYSCQYWYPSVLNGLLWSTENFS